ncbi:MAG: hypothetical protein NDJ90_09810 [Oligoflexia bacterium]|nr:hypothetical protein [Oligoflexia bacterium]
MHSRFSPLFALFAAGLLAARSLALAAPATAPSVPDRVLRDHWYIISVGTIPYGYYNDRVELRKGRLFYQNHVWKREEGFLVEEQLGAYAENTAALKPLFFNFHSTYRATELTIDGTVSPSGRDLVVKARKGDRTLPVVKRGLYSKAFFSVFFPYWLGKKAPLLKPGQRESFVAIVEDQPEQALTLMDGRVKADPKEAGKFHVSYRGLNSFWWLDAEGIPEKIEMPQQRMHVRRVSENEAKQFLENP